MIIPIRYKCVQKQYDRHKKRILKDYKSYADYIKIFYLNYAPVKYDKISAQRVENSRQFCFIPNAFPYIIPRNIQQYVLFSIRPLKSNNILKIVKNHVGNNMIFTVQINPVPEQSIPELWHCHIFIYI
jgi:hypothetical protein